MRQLRRLRANLGHRDATSSAYRARLAERGFAAPQLPAKVQPSFVRYPVWVDDRAAAVRLTAPYAVLGTWFTSVLEEAVSPTVADYELGSCPRAEAAAQHLVNLPTHPRVTRQDVEALTDALAEAS